MTIEISASFEEEEEEEEEEAPPIARLSKDLLRAAEVLTPNEARYIVDGYYQIQEYRKAARNQARTAQEAGEPELLLSWLADQAEAIEGQIKRAMAQWIKDSRPKRWLLSQKGIGHVLAAGLLAHIDIEKAPTAGHIWRFAGLDPTVVWRKGEKRPWNAELKVLCWKAGDSFVKVSNRDDAIYGQAYRQRKEIEVANNEAGLFAEQAEDALRRPRLTKQQRLYYEKGLLPPGRIDLRARRWAVKLFLSHLQHVLYEDHYGRPPALPYAFGQLDHVHYLAPPGWPID